MNRLLPKFQDHVFNNFKQRVLPHRVKYPCLVAGPNIFSFHIPKNKMLAIRRSESMPIILALGEGGGLRQKDLRFKGSLDSIVTSTSKNKNRTLGDSSVVMSPCCSCRVQFPAPT